MPIHNVHDSGYKKLFSNHTIFRQLLETFVDEPWVKELDFSQAETLDKSFVADHYKATESDLIYQVKLQGRDVYIYLLLEFQSSVDRFMAVRVGYYTLAFYMDYIANYTAIEKLPALFPIVVYNGSDRWSAPERLSELVEAEPSLGDYGLQCRYFKIAENELEREQLLAISNLVSTLFLAESHYDIELLIEAFVRLFNQEEDKRAVSLLVNWFYQLVVHGRVAEQDYEALAQEYHTAQEVRTMLIEALAKEKEQSRQQGIEWGFEQGIEQGVEQGVEQGIEQGRVAMQITLEQLLKSRFETLPEEASTKLARCTLGQLQKLVNPALDAPDLEAFLAFIPEPVEGEENPVS